MTNAPKLASAVRHEDVLRKLVFRSRMGQSNEETAHRGPRACAEGAALATPSEHGIVLVQLHHASEYGHAKIEVERQIAEEVETPCCDSRRSAARPSGINHRMGEKNSEHARADSSGKRPSVHFRPSSTGVAMVGLLPERPQRGKSAILNLERVVAEFESLFSAHCVQIEQGRVTGEKALQSFLIRDAQTHGGWLRTINEASKPLRTRWNSCLLRTRSRSLSRSARSCATCSLFELTAVVQRPCCSS